MYKFLEQNIKFLPGVGEKRAQLLADELGIRTFDDLLCYFPYKHIDRSHIYRIAEIDGNMPYVQLRGRILSFETFGEGYKRRLVAHFTDGNGVVDLVWFQGLKYVTGNYKVGRDYVVFGKPAMFGGKISVAHPDIDDAAEFVSSSVGLQPFYNTTEKMKRRGVNSRTLEKLVRTLLQLQDSPLEETMAPNVVAKNRLMSRDEAIRGIHSPRTPDELRKAELRLKFEELFYVQMNILRYMKARQHNYLGYLFKRVGEPFNRFYKEFLPFPLTGAQKRVIKEIRADMCSGKQMNRLLQGDVGSGKTLVALMCMLIAVGNGFQCCIMAPTEILASQHYETIRKMLAEMDVEVGLLTGSVRGVKRTEILQSLKDGELKILVGTHAVLEDSVVFAQLGLVIIDEQHRFGVAQRARLWTKNERPPHVLVMTATPIPRTLAMTLYGDLDVSVIDELPPGRKPVRTIHYYDSQRTILNESIRKQIMAGRQVYIVYPLIKESEKIDLKNLEDGYRQICGTFPDCNVSKVHGKMKPSEKDAEMSRFVNRETQIMVATTVIEVGVNVPNASVMVIENAERFGLSQLHQLRGRVGRGADQSYCVLVSSVKLSDETRKRLDIMVETNDGFEIAEADLKLRGPGDMEGIQQSGMAIDLKIANIARDGQLLQYVRNVADDILNSDPMLESPYNRIFRERLAYLRKTDINWSAIS